MLTLFRANALRTFVAALLAVVALRSAATGLRDNAYSNDELGFSMALPAELADAGWHIFLEDPDEYDTYDEFAVVFEGPNSAGLVVHVEELPEPMSLDTYLGAYLLMLSIFAEDWVEESTTPVDVNGVEGYELVGTLTDEIPMHVVAYVFLTETHVFEMIGEARDPVPFPLEEFRAIVDTFVLGVPTVAIRSAATGLRGNAYSNDELEFSMALPAELADAGWHIFLEDPDEYDTYDEFAVVFEGPNSAGLVVHVEELPEPMSLDTYLGAYLLMLSIFAEDWVEESTTPVDVNGVEGYELVGTLTDEIPMHVVAYVFLTETHVFEMIGEARDPVPFPLEEFRAIVDTFVLGVPTVTDVSPAAASLTQWAKLKAVR